MNSDPSRPNWGLTKFHNFGQISQVRPNFTILEYSEYLELGQFRKFCDVLYVVEISFFFSCPKSKQSLWKMTLSLSDSSSIKLSDWLTDLLILDTHRDPTHWCPLRHLIRVMRKHDLTNKKQRQRHLDNTFKEWFQTPLKHWLQFDNWELDIMTRQLSWPDNWNTGQHSQLLRCLSS